MARLRRPRHPVHTLRRVAAGLLVGAALVLAVRPPPPPAPGPARVAAAPVTVAAGDLPAGAVLTQSDLAVVLLPVDVVPAGVAAEPDRLLGRVLAGGVRAGEPVTDVRLVGAGLTSRLPAGQVAAPVRLADLAVTALVRTGDRVDVLATRPDADRADVVAAAALVLAAPGPAPDAGALPPADSGVLVLAVDGETAARLAAASTTSTLTVSLPRP